MKKFYAITLILFFLFNIQTVSAVKLKKVSEVDFKPVTLFKQDNNILYRIAIHSRTNADYYFKLGYKLEQSWGEFLGTSITIINGSDTLKDSRTTINDNFTALNNGKIEISTTTLPLITTLSNLTTVGTIGSGIWRGTGIEVGYGGTGTTSPSRYQVILGNGDSGLTVASSTGATGQYLTSNGANAYPSWQTSAVDKSLNYDWTGIHSFATTTVATSTISSATIASTTITKLQVVGSATSTLPNIQSDYIGSQNTATTTLYNNVAIKGNFDLIGASYTGFKGEYMSSEQGTTSAVFTVAIPNGAKFASLRTFCDGVTYDIYGTRLIFSVGDTYSYQDLNTDVTNNTERCFYAANWGQTSAGYFRQTCTASGGTPPLCGATQNYIYFYK